MLTGHLAHGLLHTLADLDSEQKVLGITALLKSSKTKAVEEHIKHPVGLAVVLVSQWVLIYLVSVDKDLGHLHRRNNTTQIRNLMLRSMGALIVDFHMQDRRHERNRARSTANLGFLYHAVGNPRKLRKDISLGVTYNVAYLLLKHLLLSVSSNLVWEIFSEMVVGVLLASLHLHWTCVILSMRRQAGSRVLTLPRRNMILPCVLYTLVWELTTLLPKAIGGALSTEHTGDLGSLQTIALTDTVVLITALGLRLLLLHPAYATYIYAEIQQARLTDGEASGPNASARRTDSFWNDLDIYGKTARTCFRRSTLWFALLHIQTVLITASVEILTAPLIHSMIF